MNPQDMRKGGVERQEITPAGAKEQDAINGMTAKEYSDNIAPDNKTTQYVNSGGSSAPPYGGKGHAGA